MGLRYWASPTSHLCFAVTRPHHLATIVMVGKYLITTVAFGLMSYLTALGEMHEILPGESIQQAVYNAINGDTILIHDGAYDETVVLYGKTLTIGSLFLLDGDTAHIAATTVTGTTMRPDTSSAFVYTYGEGVNGALVGLTLSGQGTWQERNQRSTGGAVHLDNSFVRLYRCRVVNSRAQEGGGLHVWGSPWLTTAFAEIQECVFQNCVADFGAGGVHARDCSLRVDKTSFISDSSFTGGLHISLSRAIVDSCLFQSCFGIIGGLNYYNSVGSIVNCVFDGNGGPTEDVPTGHLLLNSSIADVSRNMFRNSSAGCQSVMLDYGLVPLQFVGNVIEDNITSLSTGTLHTSNNTVGDVAYNIIRNNRNVHGGALYAFAGSRVHVHHNWFEGNISDDPDAGSVVVVTGLAEPRVDSNIVVNNLGQTMTARYNQIQIDARNNWWGDETGPYHAVINPNGQGDTLQGDSVLFIPWLTEPPDTTMPNAVEDRPRPDLPRTWQLMEVYPNPFNASARIVLAGFTNNDFEITLHNLLGQQVDVIHIGALTGGQLSYTAPPTLSSGVYFLKAADRHVVQTKKVVLLR